MSRRQFPNVADGQLLEYERGDTVRRVTVMRTADETIICAIVNDSDTPVAFDADTGVHILGAEYGQLRMPTETS